MITNLLIGTLLLVAAGAFFGAARRLRKHDPWRAYTPRTNEERLLLWIDRYAQPWAAEDRKQQALRKWRRDAALDQRAAIMARERRAA